MIDNESDKDLGIILRRRYYARGRNRNLFRGFIKKYKTDKDEIIYPLGFIFRRTFDLVLNDSHGIIRGTLGVTD